MHTGIGFMQMSPQVQKVVGCGWRISICLVCLARRKMDTDRTSLCAKRVQWNVACLVAEYTYTHFTSRYSITLYLDLLNIPE